MTEFCDTVVSCSSFQELATRLFAVCDKFSAHSLAVAIHYLAHDWLNLPIDDLKSVDQFKLLDVVTSSAPIGENGEIEPFQTLLVAELL